MKLLKEITIPHVTVNDETVVIVSILFKNGDKVQKDDVIIECETSKALLEIQTDQNGFIVFDCIEGEQINIDAIVARIYDQKNDIEPVDTGKESKSKTGKTIFSKNAALLIKKHNIENIVFEDKEFVSAEDVDNYLAAQHDTAQVPAAQEDGNEPQIESRPVAPVTKSAPKLWPSDHKNKFDNERIVVICLNTISFEYLEDLLIDQDDKSIVGYVVDDKYKSDSELEYLDCNVDNFPQLEPQDFYDTVIIAMAGSLRSMRKREQIFKDYRNTDVTFTNIISTSASIATNVRLGVGNIIGADVYIGTGTVMGDNNFISYRATIGHHNTIGDHNLIAPGVVMSGLVKMGDSCIVPAGVNFIDQVSIGNNVVLPVGYNVITSLEDDTAIKMKMRG